VGHRLHLEFTPDNDAQLEVSIVLQGAQPEDLRVVENGEKATQETAHRMGQTLAEHRSGDSEAAERIDQLVTAWASARGELRKKIRFELTKIRTSLNKLIKQVQDN
jgi:hypothetical protein